MTLYTSRLFSSILLLVTLLWIIAAPVTSAAAQIPSDFVTIQGTVKDIGRHGWPLYARITVIEGNQTVFTDPVSGHFTLLLLQDVPVQLRVESQGYVTVYDDVVPTTDGQVVDYYIWVDTTHCTAPGYLKKVDSYGVHCIFVPGSMLVGNVLDGATGSGINGAVVYSDDTPWERTKTFATPDDPNLPDGMYLLFTSLSGIHNFTARYHWYDYSGNDFDLGYTRDTRAVDLTPETLTRQNFTLYDHFTWTGAIDTHFSNPANWFPNAVPGNDEYVADNVVIPSGLIYYPVVDVDAHLNNLDIQPGASFELPEAYKLTARGQVQNRGKLILHSSGPYYLFHIYSDWSRINYFGIEIYQEGDMGAVKVEIHGEQPCTGHTEPSVKRCIEIIPTNPPQQAALAFFYNNNELPEGMDPSSVKAWHYQEGWQEAGTVIQAGAVRSDLYEVLIENVQNLSHFILKPDPMPTAITLSSFQARSAQPRVALFALLVGLTLGLILLYRRINPRVKG